MGLNNNIHLISFFLILVTGIMSTTTDICHRKIRNEHLFGVVTVGIICVLFSLLCGETIHLMSVWNIALAMVISWAFFAKNLWAGGDAKLFVLYSFLMPVDGLMSGFILTSVTLFLNTFIIALVYLSLHALYEFSHNPKTNLKRLFEAWKSDRPGITLLGVFCISWLNIPLLEITGLSQFYGAHFLSVYLISMIFRHQLPVLLGNKFCILGVLVGGFLLRTFIVPESIGFEKLIGYSLTILIYSSVIFLFNKWEDELKNRPERVPFAPLLFMGCLLSYTPFLSIILSIQKALVFNPGF